MKHRFASVAMVVSVLMLGSAGALVEARDYGVMGETFPIAEPDLLSVISGRLHEKEANGEIEALNRRMVANARSRVRNPPPVQGLRGTVEAKSWLHDPSVVVGEDIRDHEGNVIVARGTRANPLETIPFNRRLVFIRGSSKAQVEWALREFGDPNSRIVFVDGSPFEVMQEYDHQVYFDQSGFLTTRFGIKQVPATVEGEGTNLRIRELLPPVGEGEGG